MSVGVQAVTSTHSCKFPNCANDARAAIGRYSYCADHQGMGGAKELKAAPTTIAGKLSALQAQARKVDRLRAKAERLTREALKAKRDADEEQSYFARQLSELGKDRAA